MDTTIIHQIRQLETEKGIIVLYACESGSRAWGFPSPDSDFDVRIIYMHPKDWYWSIEDHKDTLELPINDLLDISGWDLRKSLQILRKSNAVIFEWLQSPIIYYNQNNFREQLFELAPSYFSARTVIHHHIGLANNAYQEIVQQSEVKLKKYFYILRSLLSAIWVREVGNVPPMEFQPLTQLLNGQPNILDTICEWQLLKAQSMESAKVLRFSLLDNWIESELKACSDFAKSIPPYSGEVGPLNQFFKKWLA